MLLLLLFLFFRGVLCILHVVSRRWLPGFLKLLLSQPVLFFLLELADQFVTEGKHNSTSGQLVHIGLSTEAELLDFGIKVGIGDWFRLREEVQLLFWRILRNAQIELLTLVNPQHLIVLILLLEVFIIITTVKVVILQLSDKSVPALDHRVDSDVVSLAARLPWI